MTSSSGAASYSVPMNVPPGVQGMQPSLALSYSSDGGNSWFGYGWGISVGYPLFIERMGEKRSVTQYGDTDEFYWGGSKLIEISRSPGVKTTYETEIQSFLKIESSDFDQNSDRQPREWTVIYKGGTKLYYKVESPTPTPLFNNKYERWFLQTVTDIYGNQISLEYAHENDSLYQADQVHLGKIKYTHTGVVDYKTKGTNGDNEVAFIAQNSLRPDPIVMHTFNKPVVVEKLFDRIDVKHKINPVRTYQLSYQPSPATNRTLLASVKECTDNTCIKSLPPYKFLYPNKTRKWGKKDLATNELPLLFTDVVENLINAVKTPFAHDEGQRLEDINCDGRDDIIQAMENSGIPYKVLINDGKINNAYKFHEYEWPLPHAPVYKITKGRGNGDRYVDNGVYFIDINGDQCVDIVRSLLHVNENASEVPLQDVCINTRQGFDCDESHHGFQLPPVFFIKRWFNSYLMEDLGIRFADLDGNGLVDLIKARHPQKNTPIFNDPGNGKDTPKEQGVWLNNGSGWTQITDGKWNVPFGFMADLPIGVNYDSITNTIWTAYGWLPTGANMQDINGDNLADLVLNNAFNDTPYRRVWLNNGKSFEKQSITHQFRPNSTITEHLVKLIGTSYNVYRAHVYSSLFFDVDGNGLVDQFYADNEQGKSVVSGIIYNHWPASFTSDALPMAISLAEIRSVPYAPYNVPAAGPNFDRLLDRGFRIGDLAGNGLSGLAQGLHWFNDAPVTALLEREDILADLLTSVVLPTGGRLDYDYRQATKVDGHDNLCSQYITQPVYGAAYTEAGLIDSYTTRYVVVETQVSDPLTNHTQTTRYEYDSGRYKYTERENRGFAYVKSYQVKSDAECLAGTCPFTETCYGQTDKYQGLTLWSRSGEYSNIANAQGLVNTATNTYVIETNYPSTYQQKLTQVDTTMYAKMADQAASSKSYRKYIDPTWYDNYGQLTRAIDYGEVGVESDNVLTHIIYLPAVDDGTTYVADRVKSTAIYENNGGLTQGQWLSYSENAYSNSPDTGTVFNNPGDYKYLRQSKVAKDYTDRDDPTHTTLITTAFEYYDRGALKQTKAPAVEVLNRAGERVTKSLVTTYEYGPIAAPNDLCGNDDDTCDNGLVLPCKVTVAADDMEYAQSTVSEHDLATGQMLWSQSSDGQKVINTYDEFGRPKTVKKAGIDCSNALISYDYTLVGEALGPTNPNTTRVTTNSGLGRIEESVSFINGFGEAVQTRKKADESQGLYSGLTVANSLGQAWKVYPAFMSPKTGFIPESEMSVGYREMEYLAGQVTKAYDMVVSGSRTSTETIYGAGYSIVKDAEGAKTKSETMVDDAQGLIFKQVTRNYQGEPEIKKQSYHDRVGRLVQVLDVRDHITTALAYTYDALGNIVGRNVQDYNFASEEIPWSSDNTKPYQVRYQYNNLGKLVLEQWGSGDNPTYGAFDDKFKYIQVKHAYDVLGRDVAVCVTDYDSSPIECDKKTGNVVAYKYYDKINNQLQGKYSVGKMVHAIGYGLLGYQDASCNGHEFCEKVYGETGTVSYVYDNPQGLVSEISQNVTKYLPSGGQESVKIGFNYDNVGKLLKIDAPDGYKIRYNYDLLGRLANYRNAPAVSVNGSAILESAKHDDRARLQELTYGNGLVTEYGYNDRDWLTKLDHGKDASNNDIYTANYLHDDMGNVKTITLAPTGDVTYVYDALYRLKTVTDGGYYKLGGNFSYEYDLAGNIISKTESEPITIEHLGQSNRMRQVTYRGTTTHPLYDNHGNLITDALAHKDQSKAFLHDYDYSNRIVLSERSTDDNQRNWDELTFSFDGLGRKLRRVLASRSGGSFGYPEGKWYFYTGDQRLFEIGEVNGAPKERSLYISAYGKHVAKINTVDLEKRPSEYYHHDHLGSVVAVSNDGGIPVNAPGDDVEPKFEYSVGGQVTGLRNNEQLLLELQPAGIVYDIRQNGPFAFVVKVTPGVDYSYTIVTKQAPEDKTCRVTNPSGTLTTYDVNHVFVECACGFFCKRATNRCISGPNDGQFCVTDNDCCGGEVP